MSDVTIEDITSIPSPGKKVVLLFWASWHEGSAEGGPMDLVLRTLSTSIASDTIRFGRVEAEEVPQVAQKYGVTVVPTFVLLREDGQVFQSIQGSDNISQITQAVQALVASSSVVGDGGNEAVVAATTISLEDRLKALTTKSPVMLFMKGVPSAPRCGFSRQAIELLEEEQIVFGSFDILTDDTVRQGLKEYSDWPTYPQLYVNGEFMGGLDIMKEMKEESSLKEQLDLPSNATTTTTPPATTSIEDRLKALITKSSVMLFMKGVPSAPRCGFSRQIVEILDSLKVPYDTFNILEDEEVRQSLKTYSDWPTYPQLYAHGEFLGGLDICKELIESGELEEMLTGSE